MDSFLLLWFDGPTLGHPCSDLWCFYSCFFSLPARLGCGQKSSRVPQPNLPLSLSNVFFPPSTCSLGLLFSSPSPFHSVFRLENPPSPFMIFFVFSFRSEYSPLPPYPVHILFGFYHSMPRFLLVSPFYSRPQADYSIARRPYTFAFPNPAPHSHTYKFYPTRVPFSLFICFRRAWVSCHF